MIDLLMINIVGERQNPQSHQREHQQQSGHVVILWSAGVGGHDPGTDLLSQEILWSEESGVRQH